MSFLFGGGKQKNADDQSEVESLNSKWSGWFTSNASKQDVTAEGEATAEGKEGRRNQKKGVDEEAAGGDPTDSPSVEGGSSYVIAAVPAEQPTTGRASLSLQGNSNKPNCVKRFVAELNPFQPWFAVSERATSRKIDIPESFAPATCRAFLFKSASLGLAVATMVYGIVAAQQKEYYFAYFVHWALLLSCLYFASSFSNTVLASRTPQPPDTAGCRIRTTWVLFEMAMHTELLSVIVFWLFQYQPGVTPMTFLSVVPHSVIAFLVFVDGNIVNRIPVRWTHWYGFVLPLEMLYVGWTVVYDLIVANSAGAGAENESLYDSLSWKEDWQRALIVSVIALFGVGPALYLLMWIISAYYLPCFCAYNRHVYIDSNNYNPTDARSEVGEESIFGRWR